MSTGRTSSAIKALVPAISLANHRLQPMASSPWITSPPEAVMTVLRLEHIGIVVDDIPAATAFFLELGLELEGETSVEGDLVDRINGLEGVEADIAILRTPDG